MIIPKNERLIIEAKADQEKEYKLLKQYNPKIDGGTIFEYCTKTGELRRAVFVEQEEIVLGIQPKKKIATNKNCLYVEALNAKNAIKHLKNGNVILST